MTAGRSKEAMDMAKNQVVTQEGEPVKSIEESQESVRLWGRIKNYTRVAVEQVMDMITGVMDGYDLEEKTEILAFSSEHCAKLLEKAGEPVDEKAVWQAYDLAVRTLDIVTMIPAQWEKHLDPKFWDLPPLPHVPRERPITKQDYAAVKKLPYKHKLHVDKLPAFEPKYKISA
jgi:hypothetical protein